MSAAEERRSQELAEELNAALIGSVAEARRKCAGERFYAYVLYTLPSFEYAVLLFHTEEALARAANDDRSRAELRWSPPDWESAQSAEERFGRVNEILASLAELQGHEDAGCRKRCNVFMDVLKSLDAQGVFGTSASREAAVVNIMWGDQDLCAHVKSARELNPKTSYLGYAGHVLPSLRAWEREIEGSPSAYKVEALARIRRTITQVERDLGSGPGH